MVGREGAFGRRKREGGLVLETVKRSGRSWRCRPVRLTREMYIHECVWVYNLSDVCAHTYSWRGVGGMCEAYWTRVLAAARVNMKKPGAGHSTPPWERERSAAALLALAASFLAVNNTLLHSWTATAKNTNPRGSFIFFPVPTFVQEIQRNKSKWVCLVWESVMCGRWRASVVLADLNNTPDRREMLPNIGLQTPLSAIWFEISSVNNKLYWSLSFYNPSLKCCFNTHCSLVCSWTLEEVEILVVLQRPPEFSDLDTRVSSVGATDPGPAEEIERKQLRCWSQIKSLTKTGKLLKILPTTRSLITDQLMPYCTWIGIIYLFFSSLKWFINAERLVVGCFACQLDFLSKWMSFG